MSKKPPAKSWNYRVLAFFIDDDRKYFEVRTVYYEDGLPISYGEHGHPINGSTLRTTKITMKQMAKAFEKPVLWGDERFPNKYKKLKKK